MNPSKSECKAAFSSCPCPCHAFCTCKCGDPVPVKRAWLERLDELQKECDNTGSNMDYQEKVALLLGYLESVKGLITKKP